jgi:histidinol-phosphate aminotransferase
VSEVDDTTVGRPRAAVMALPAYRPGKSAAQAQHEHGLDEAIKLASNETPFGPLPSIAAAMHTALEGMNRYPDHRATDLRRRLADKLDVGDDQVTVGCGSVGLLQQIVLSYVDAGDEVIYPWRSFEVYPIYTQLAGATPVTPGLVDHEFDLVAVSAAVTARTKLVLLANPNNPTGTAVPMASVGRLLDEVPDDVIVVLDEAYREFMDPGLGDPISNLIGEHRNLVVLRTFSKAQGLASLRVGYAIGDPDVISTIDRTLVPFAVNGLAQAAAMASLDSADELAERVSLIVSERARVVASVREQGWTLPEPQANFVWLPVLGEAMALFDALERRGIVTRPFEEEGVRVTIGAPGENDRFLAAMAELIDNI